VWKHIALAVLGSAILVGGYILLHAIGSLLLARIVALVGAVLLARGPAKNRRDPDSD
jgi:hypothetical protein